MMLHKYLWADIQGLVQERPFHATLEYVHDVNKHSMVSLQQARVPRRGGLPGPQRQLERDLSHSRGNPARWGQLYWRVYQSYGLEIRSHLQNG